MIEVIVKINAKATVILLRFRSIIVVPEKVVGKAPPKASDRPEPFPECNNIAIIRAKDTKICIPTTILNIVIKYLKMTDLAILARS